MTKKQKHHQKHVRPPIKPAPTPPAEPEDIAGEELSEAEKKSLEADLKNYAAGAGLPIVSPVPPQYRAAHTTEIKTYAIELPPSAQAPKQSPLGSSPLALGATVAKQAQAAAEHAEAGAKLGSVFAEYSAPRLALSELLERLACNIAIGAELFAGLNREELALVLETYQQAVNKLLTTIQTEAIALEPLDLRGLVALTLRGQEDRHNRRSLLDLCARLGVSAEELTLAMVKENLALEAWRLGEAANEIPNLEINTQNELLWRAYKEELGLVKRRK